ncbi:MAG: hypothetical protein Q9168_002360 [Polycauliona sp. 1 TL-2023]
MASTTPSASLVGVPQSVLNKLPLLDKSMEDLMQDYDTTYPKLCDLKTALREHVYHLIHLEFLLEPRHYEIKAVATRHDGSIIDAHIEGTDRFNETLKAILDKLSLSCKNLSDWRKKVGWKLDVMEDTESESEYWEEINERMLQFALRRQQQRLIQQSSTRHQ